MDSYFSSRVLLSRSPADALPSDGFSPSPPNLCNVVLHDRYRILKLLGQGGFGRTFLARDEQSDRTFFCVIKQLFRQDRDGDCQRASERFQQEAQRLATLGEHPQIPQLLTTFEEDGDAFIVQEWVHGWTLQHALADAVPFDEMDIWQVLRSLLPILQYLHAHQVIHRDVKPANIIRRVPLAIADSRRKENTHLVLVDFGAAKHLSTDSAVQTDTLIGSAEYASPEQLRGQAVFASDLYSLGVTCVHLLTQLSPFDLYDSGENAWKWQVYLPVPISPRLERILCKLLQPALRQRYQTAAEVLHDLNLSNRTLADVNLAGKRAIAPRSQPSSSSSLPELSSREPLSVAPTAVMQAALATRSIPSMTVFEPQTQTWHHLTMIDPSHTLRRDSDRRGREMLLPAATRENNPIELIFSVLLIVILTSLGSMTLICFFFEMERHTPVLPVEHQLPPKVIIK